MTLTLGDIAAPRLRRRAAGRKVAIGLCLALPLLGACSVVPSDGPNSHTITKAATRPGQAGYVLINLDFRVAQIASSIPTPVLFGLTGKDSGARHDLIREGDNLSVAIFEPTGASLFQSNSPDSSFGPAGGAQEALPRLTVNADGAIEVPFAGAVRVAGLTAEGAAAAIRNGLHGRVANPQVLVNILSSSANSVSVLGEVRNVGRFPLTANSDRLLDVIAAAGGPTKPYQDIEVQIVRGGETVSAPMALLMTGTGQDIRLAPHDQIRLLPKERKYSVFGAFGRVTQTPMVDDHISLATAMSRVGGLDNYTANDSAIFVFRFERPEVVKALGLTGTATPRGVPMVYRLNLRSNGASLLVADAFNIENGDIIYVPRAGLVALQKFMQIVNSVAQTGYSVKVTGVP
jgi:polysaccharide export outer membrane protein